MMRFARLVEERGTCDRQQVGAVVTTPDGRRILGYGYNGNAAGEPDTCDDPLAPGNCGCVHAEVNALLSAESTRGAYLFTTCAPCLACAKLIVNAGIDTVHYEREYRNDEGKALLERADVTIVKSDL